LSFGWNGGLDLVGNDWVFCDQLLLLLGLAHYLVDVLHFAHEFGDLTHTIVVEENSLKGCSTIFGTQGSHVNLCGVLSLIIKDLSDRNTLSDITW